jgi:hypothetical protein
MKTSFIFKTTLMFFLFLSNFSYSTPIPYPGLSEYYVLCHLTGPRLWNIQHPRSKYTEAVIGRHGTDPISFCFSRNGGSWEDFLNDENTYEDCLIEEAYQYLQHWSPCSNHAFTYRDLSSLKWIKRGDIDIPFLDGSWFHGSESGFFRLYIFPTKSNRSTYYLCIKIVSFKKFPCHEQWYKRVYEFIATINTNRDRPYKPYN